ncbi:MAG TPA: hypothetical protein VGJ18_17840 [Gemmatimonadaceae bacterium]|jgi:hypothetical protein
MRPFVRAASALLLAVGIAACSESPAGIHRGTVSLAFAPQFSAAAATIYKSLSAFAVTIDNVHVVVRAAPTGDVAGAVLKDTTVAFPATADQVTIDIEVELQSSQQSVVATVDLQQGTTAYFEGTQQFVASQGQTTTSPQPVVLSYVGPGANATSLLITPTISSQPVTIAPSTSFTFQVEAFNQAQQQVAGLPVKWQITDLTIASVNADGTVTSTGKAGSTTLTATALNGISAQATVDVEPVTQLVVLRGDNQTGVAGAALSATMTVQALAANTHGVSGASINFGTVNGQGSVSPASATTDLGGLAVTRMTLGSSLGTYVFTASLAGTPSIVTRVSATATASAAAALSILSGNNLSDTVRSTLAQPLRVKVTDAFGNAVSKQIVNFQVTAGRASLVAAVGTAPQTLIQTATDTNGIAQVSLVADTLAGPIVVTASLPQTTVPAVAFAATVKAGQPALLTMLQQPSATAQATITLGVQPKVQVADQFGNPVAVSGLLIDVNPVFDCALRACGRIVPSSKGRPSLNRTAAPSTSRIPVPTAISRTQSISDTFPQGIGGKTEAQTDVNGVATFTNLSLNLSTGPWQLQFVDTTSAVTLSPAVSNDVQLSPGPAASIIAWGVADTTFLQLTGDSLTPSVRIIDKVGNGVPNVSVNFVRLDSFSVFTNVSTQTDADGIATAGLWLLPVGVPGPFQIQAIPGGPSLENAPLTLTAVP